MRGVEPTRIPSGPRARRGTQAASALGAVSHAIRLNELSTVSTNVAIPTIWLRGAARCRGELHATFAESSPGGTHALPLIAPPVAQPLARQWRASGLTRWIPSPQTTCPSPTETDQGTTHRPTMKPPPTRFAHPPRWHQPTKTPTFPHQHAEKSPHNQHTLPVNPTLSPASRQGITSTPAAHADAQAEGQEEPVPPLVQ